MPNKTLFTQHLADIGKRVDKFHFRNHVDPWCQENCNPEGVESLQGVNTQVCEQLFKKVNSHKNCKSFNEDRFFMFFIHQFGIHNLAIEGLETKMADLREEFRWENIQIKDPVIIDNHEELVSELENLKITPNFTCSICGSGYTQAGYLKRHVEMKHESKTGPECEECGKLFANPKSLAKHMKTHLKCNICKQEFEIIEDATKHKLEHTICKFCHKDFKFVSKLTKHISSMHKSE